MNRGRKKEILLIVLGIAIAAVPFLLRMQERGRSDHYIQFIEQEEDENDRNEKQKKNHKKETALLSEEDTIGIIEIPDLDIRYPIFEGAGTIQLNEGIGHMEDSTELCGKGNCVLAGHNGSSRGIYFTYLSNIKAGDNIKITNKEKITHVYVVSEIRTVNPYDTWVTEKADIERLTLFTCASHGSKRLAVRCVPVEPYDEGGDAEKNNDK